LATNKAPSFEDSSLSLEAIRGVNSSDHSFGKYKPRSCTQPSKSVEVILFGKLRTG